MLASGKLSLPGSADDLVLDAPLGKLRRRPARLELHRHVPLLSILLFALMGLLGPVIAPVDPLVQDRGQELSAPSLHHPLGADELGRDILSRLLAGTRVSLLVGVLSVSIGALVGGTGGLVAGYAGGLVDNLLSRAMDVLLAFPPVLLGIAVVALLGAGAAQAAIAIGIASLPQFGRLARDAVLRERVLDYVTAAESLGATERRVLFRHVLPNVLAPLILQAALAMGFAVLLEATLGFLGLGAQPPEPSWGVLLRESRAYLREAPWYAISAGVPLTLLILSLTAWSDALRERFDPARGSGPAEE
jgi:peptide/nickel transport system permease protein